MASQALRRVRWLIGAATGRYTVAVSATNSDGLTSATRSLSFTVVR